MSTEINNTYQYIQIWNQTYSHLQLLLNWWRSAEVLGSTSVSSTVYVCMYCTLYTLQEPATGLIRIYVNPNNVESPASTDLSFDSYAQQRVNFFKCLFLCIWVRCTYCTMCTYGNEKYCGVWAGFFLSKI